MGEDSRNVGRNLGTLLFNLSPSQKSLIRKYENLNKKLINARNAVVFNKTCIKENLLPNYTDTSIYIWILQIHISRWSSR